MAHFKNGKLLWFWLSAVIIIISAIATFTVQWTKVNNNTVQIIENKIEVEDTFNSIETEIKEFKVEMNEQFNDMGKVMVKIETNITYIQRDIQELKEDVKKLK